MKQGGIESHLANAVKDSGEAIAAASRATHAFLTKLLPRLILTAVGLLLLGVGLLELARRWALGQYHSKLDYLARLGDMDPHLSAAIGWAGLWLILVCWRYSFGAAGRWILRPLLPIFGLVSLYWVIAFCFTFDWDLGFNGIPRVLQRVDPERVPWFKSDGTPLLCVAERNGALALFYRYQPGVKFDPFGNVVRPVQPGDWRIYEAQRAKLQKDLGEIQQRLKDLEAKHAAERARKQAAAAAPHQSHVAPSILFRNEGAPVGDTAGVGSGSFPPPRFPSAPCPTREAQPSRAVAFPLRKDGWRVMPTRSGLPHVAFVWCDRTIEVGIPPRAPVILQPGRRLRMHVGHGEAIRARQISSGSEGTMWIQKVD